MNEKQIKRLLETNRKKLPLVAKYWEITEIRYIKGFSCKEYNGNNITPRPFYKPITKKPF